MLADPAAHAFFLVHHRPQLAVHGDRLIEKGAMVVTAPAEGSLPVQALLFIEPRSPHPDLFPFFHPAVQGAGRAYRHTLHAEIAGGFPGQDDRRAHDRQAVEQPGDPDRPVGAG